MGGAGTRAALLDAGWPDWTVDPERVAVIIGNAIGGDKQHLSDLRIQFPKFARDLCAAPSFAALPEQVRDAVIAETRDRVSHRVRGDHRGHDAG